MLKVGSLSKSGKPRSITVTVLALATVKLIPSWMMLIFSRSETGLKVQGAAQQLWHREAEFGDVLGQNLYRQQTQLEP